MPRRSRQVSVWWFQSLPKPFSRTCRGPTCTNALSVKPGFSTRFGMFLHKTKVHSYKSPQVVVYFRRNTCPRCKSLFATEKSANDHYRRNLKRKFCARPRGPDASNVPPRRVAPSPPKNRGKKRKRAPHAANAFWSLWIRGSRRSRAETLPGLFRQRRRRSWPAVEQAANHYQSQNPRKSKPHPMVQEE